MMSLACFVAFVIRVISVRSRSQPKRSKCWGSCSVGVWHFKSTSRRWRDHAVTMHRPSDTCDTCWSTTGTNADL